jgi:predicted DNA-binding transcriptional regulator YafY
LMRADRLVSLILLLQARGRMTAQQLAQELEVSERTIYRDIDALSTAGVPVYADRGPGGGFDLLDSYRTDLTGLTAHEVRALFTLSMPAALGQLGLGQELRAALLKLSAALPPERRRDESWVRQRIHLDWSWWAQSQGPVPNLQTIQRAVWDDRKLWLAYRVQYGAYDHTYERLVEPYGLVCKAGVWYLVCAAGGRVRVYELSRLFDVRIENETFARPADFDLEGFWGAWCSKREGRRPRYVVALRVAPSFVPDVAQHLSEGMREWAIETGLTDERGWTSVTVAFDSLYDARARILGLGGAVEVLEPEPLRRSVLDFARHTVELYESRARGHPN